MMKLYKKHNIKRMFKASRKYYYLSKSILIPNRLHTSLTCSHLI